MPRRATYTSACIEALPALMSRASSEVTMRQMLAAEAIIPSIDPNQRYVLSETLCKVVGNHFPASAGESVRGRDLCGDLATLVLELSAHLTLDGNERSGGAASPEVLAGEMGIASKTLQRWRRDGLCVHWMKESITAPVRIAIYRSSVESFVAKHRTECDRACNFKRYNHAERARILEIGRALVASGVSLNLAAKEAARQVGRSHEGVRLLFLREIGMPREPRRSAGEVAARFAERAWRLGIEPARIALRLERSESLVRALVDRRRGEILRGVQPSWVELATFDLPNADETIPNATAAKKPQLLGLVDGDMLASLASARALRSEFAKDGRAAAERDETRAAAMHFLIRRASKAIDALARWPDRASLDRIETDLRRALRIRAVLTERGLVLALVRADHYCHGGPERLPSDELRTLGRAIVSAVNEVVNAFDPSRQKFDRAVNLAADFALAKLVNARRSNRAAARHSTTVPLRLLGTIAQWQDLVDPMQHHADRIANFIASRGPHAVAAKLLARRYGWCGFAPSTIEALAEQDHTTVALMSRRLRSAENTIRHAE
jgi:hypothetical protein